MPRTILYWTLVAITVGGFFLASKIMPYVQARVRFGICSMSDADRIMVMRFDEGTAVYEILKVHRSPAVRWVDYMYYRYLWSGRSWVKVKYELQEMSFAKLYETHSTGLTQAIAEERVDRYGANALDVPVPSYFKLFYTEVIHPFYIFQIASVAIWLWDEYWIYASCIAVMAIASAVFSVWQARKNREMLAEMCYSESVVRVVRRRPTSSPVTSYNMSGPSINSSYGTYTNVADASSSSLGDQLYFENIPSREIAPGDLVEIRADTTVPCDLLLVQGQCVINESALTGESVPVAKVTIPHKENDIFHLDVHGPKHVLFNGTGVVQTRPDFAPDYKRSGAAGATSNASSAYEEPVLRLDYESFGGDSGPSSDTNPADQPLVLGLAISTGFSTAKGDLIRSILFPRPTRFKFYRDSMRFIAVLLGIALIGLVYTIIIFTKYGSPVASMIKRALDLITITVPPALPIAMSIATAFSVRRLKKESIFCTSPQRINVCGRIDVMCFDKTGTLTEDSLDVHGVLPARARPGSIPTSSHVSLRSSALVGASGTEFGAFLQDLDKSPDALLHSLSCCHSLSLLHGNLIGDPLEIKMFEATAWTLVDSGHVVSPDKFTSIKTLKFFEFSSLLQRMSVVVEEGTLPLGSSGSPNHADGGSNVWVYSKGAPEVIKSLCVPSSLPASFDAELSSYTQQGKRVLALARKRLPETTLESASSVARAEAETRLEFLGLFVLQNQLKGDTTAAILNIAGGSVANVMVTGDNEYTAMNVARQCGILAESEALGDAAVYLISLDFENDIPTGLRYTYIPGIDPDGPDGESRRHTVIDMHLSASTGDLHDPMLLEASMPEASLPDAEMVNLNLGSSYESDYANSYGSSVAGSYNSSSGQLVSRPSAPTMGLPPSIGSPAPRMGLSSSRSVMRSSTSSAAPLLQFHSVDDLKHDNHLFAVHGKAFDYIRVHDRKLFAYVLKYGRVYARMTPFDKSHLIEGLQTLGHTVGMCGDGANDVGALKAADVGLSLSDAEASVAAPFTSKVPSIRSMWTLLREGRCALASSIACYKYMACYSMIQLITCVLLYSIWWDSRLTDPQFLWIDIFLVFPLSFFMGATKPREELSSRKPPGALVSLSVVGSVVLQTILHFLSQLLFFIYLSRSYIPQYHPEWDLHTSTIFRVGALFLFANFEYIGTCLAYSISKPWRKGLWTNYAFAISLLLLFAGNVWMTFYPPKWVAKLLQISEMEMWLKVTLFIAALLEMAVAWGIERFIIIVAVQPYEERTTKLSPLENWADDPKVRLSLSQ